MTKIMTIEINESDESVLLEIFKRFKVKIKDRYLTSDQQVIRENLRQKYVVTGEWEKMSLEDKEDAALYEQILIRSNEPSVDINGVLNFLKEGITTLKTVDTDVFIKKLEDRQW